MNIVGTIQRHADFPSRFVAARNVDVWFPPDYSEEKRYPVLYMHDGQNLFEPISSIGGVAWEVDKAIARLVEAKKIPSVIVVGVWNSDIRWREYMPQKAYEAAGFEERREAFLERAGGPPLSDSYLRFLVEEIKPFVDANYPTLPDQRDTFVMGSSMGGLISLYAVSRYPDVFYGAGCVSTHWSAGRGELVDEMAKMLPDPKSHKLYFDYGTVGLDAEYEPFQLQMDVHLRNAGYDESNWMTRKFDGADHNEAAWHARVKIPLLFLLARRIEVESNP
jgi:predicted alpha/beta superfamily hydrolase